MDFKQFSSLASFQKAFPDEASCVAYFAQIRWQGSPVCPYCSHNKVYTLKGKVQRYKCAGCKTLFSVRVRSIFEDSNLPLLTWFTAIYLCCNNPKGMSSVTLGKFLGRPQKTAWHILSKVRVMLAEVAPVMLTGEVEIDELYHGGVDKNKHKAKRSRGAYGTKAPVLGLVQRGGPIVIKAIAKSDRNVIAPVMREHVAIGTSVYTDTFAAYKHLNYDGYAHDSVNHGRGQYTQVTKDGTYAHTNTIEG